MAQQQTEQKVNRPAVHAIATAIASGLNEVNATGSLLTQVCKIAKQQFKGKAIPKLDVTAILDELTSRMGWKGPTADVRRSEYKSVLGQYHVLDEAIEEYRNKKGGCTWHDGIALSRLLKKLPPKRAALAHANRKSGGSAAAPKSRGDAKAVAASAIKRVLKLPKLERAFVEQLRNLCAEYSIKL